MNPYITDSVLESAVGVLLVEAGSRRNAMTISCFSEAAHHPATLWISLAKTAYSNALILETGRFSLAILNRNQRRLLCTAARFLVASMTSARLWIFITIRMAFSFFDGLWRRRLVASGRVLKLMITLCLLPTF